MHSVGVSLLSDTYFNVHEGPSNELTRQVRCVRAVKTLKQAVQGDTRSTSGEILPLLVHHGLQLPESGLGNKLSL